ncbi:MAG: DUF4286 family protein [Gemmataceae bacterium]|nr:DUF4286 family protein [Gemmataceae bacterium]
MPELVYTVAVTLPDEETARQWVHWLREGHVADVIAGGATSAEIVVMDGSPYAYEVRYRFPSRDGFDRYERECAPRLRAEGLKLFPVERGIAYRRSVGVVVQRLP